MKLFADMHVHSKFSIDGTSTMEEYCLTAEKTGSRIICFTEHVDFNSMEKNLSIIKDSGHYRTEFRLGAYSDAVGMSYRYGEATIDIIARKPSFGDGVIRVYMDGATLEQCEQMIWTASPIMDRTATTEDIQTTVDYVDEHKSANGYYYSNLGLLLLGNDTKGYELMLKMGND